MGFLQKEGEKERNISLGVPPHPVPSQTSLDSQVNLALT